MGTGMMALMLQLHSHAREQAHSNAIQLHHHPTGYVPIKGKKHRSCGAKKWAALKAVFGILDFSIDYG